MLDFLTKNATGVDAFSKLLSAGGSIYGGIMQQDAARKLMRLEKQKYNFNKEQVLKDEEDMLKSREAVSNAFASPKPLLNLKG